MQIYFILSHNVWMGANIYVFNKICLKKQSARFKKLWLFCQKILGAGGISDQKQESGKKVTL